MSAQTLLDKAWANLTCSQLIINNLSDDEEQLNIAAYHLSQAVEMAVKYVLELSGIEYPKTHDIEQLSILAARNNVNLFLTDYLKDHTEMLSLWGAKSRYILNYSVERKKILKTAKEVASYLDILENQEL